MELGTHRLESEKETLRAASDLAGLLRPNDVLALVGELGAGKTLFATGLARGMGVPEECYVASPSFALIHEYPARLPLYHIDLYRISSVVELEDLGLHEYFEREGVSAVEWFDRFRATWPAHTLEIELRLAAEEPDTRLLVLSGDSDRASELAAAWLERLRNG